MEAKHLLAAVIMTAPGTLLLATILVPETESPQTSGTVKLDIPRTDASLVGAAARGTGEGLHLALNVAAMLISFLALVGLVNAVLGGFGGLFGYPQLSLELILGRVLQPLAVLMGVPVADSAYLAVGITLEGTKDVLGIWLEQTEGAKFWMKAMTEVKNRGVQDIYMACVDGLKGFPDAIEAIFPKTEVQLCIVHMVRNSLRFVSWKDRKNVAADLKAVYRAVTEEQARLSLSAFAQKWYILVLQWPL